MEKDFVPLDRALKLQEIGFNEPCIAWYYGTDFWMVDQRESAPINYRTNPIRGGNGVLAPTFSQVFRWFEDKHRLFGNVRHNSIGGFIDGVIPDDWEPGFLWEVYKPIGTRYSAPFNRHYSRSEAELECLSVLIRIVEKLRDSAS